MNKCLFIGRFTETPTLNTVKIEASNKEIHVVNFTLAISRKFKKGNGITGKQVIFLDFEAWDSGAEVISKYCQKGSKILVITSARNDVYTASDGIKRNKIKFRVEEFELLNDRRDNDNRDDTSDNSSS